MCELVYDECEALRRHKEEAHSGDLVVAGEEEELLQEPLVLTTQGLLQAASR
jgi:hypothetical protein